MRNIRSLLVLAIIFFGIVLVFKFCTNYQRKTIAKLEAKIELLKSETIPLKFMIIEKKDSMITFITKFMDMDGNEITKDTFNLKGNELSFDFYSVPFEQKQRYLAFPYKIYTDQIAPNDGILLYSYYDKGGYPMVYVEKDMNKELKEGLKELFTILKEGKETDIKDYFGNMVHDLKYLREFQTGAIYKIVTRTKGGIEVMLD